MGDEPYPWPDSENVVDAAEQFQQLQFNQQLELLEKMREVQRERTAAIMGSIVTVGFFALVGWIAYLLINR